LTWWILSSQEIVNVNDDGLFQTDVAVSNDVTSWSLVLTACGPQSGKTDRLATRPARRRLPRNVLVTTSTQLTQSGDTLPSQARSLGFVPRTKPDATKPEKNIATKITRS